MTQLSTLVNSEVIDVTMYKRKKSKRSKKNKKEISGLVLGIAERGGRTRSLKIKSLTLYRLS